MLHHLVNLYLVNALFWFNLAGPPPMRGPHLGPLRPDVPGPHMAAPHPGPMRPEVTLPPGPAGDFGPRGPLPARGPHMGPEQGPRPSMGHDPVTAPRPMGPGGPGPMQGPGQGHGPRSGPIPENDMRPPHVMGAGANALSQPRVSCRFFDLTLD